MRNSHRDVRKNGKLEKRYLGPYTITECLGKGVYKLSSTKTGEHCVFSCIVVCRIFVQVTSSIIIQPYFGSSLIGFGQFMTKIWSNVDALLFELYKYTTQNNLN